MQEPVLPRNLKAPPTLLAPPPAGEEALYRVAKMEDAERSLWDYLWIVRKRLWLVLTFLGGTILATLLILSLVTPIYTGVTTILIERQTPHILDIREARTEPIGHDEYDYYRTQYEILKSRTLSARVIHGQGLAENPSFPGGQEAEATGVLSRLWAGLRHFFPSSPAAEPKDALGVPSKLIDTYMERLAISPIRQTRLVRTAFSSPDPELSARVANAHVQAYIHQGTEIRTQGNKEALRFLEEKLGEIRERVERSEVDLNRYRRERGILSLDDKDNIVAQRLGDLNTRLTQAEVEKIVHEAQVRLIRKRDYNALPAVIENTLIQTLKEQLAHVEGELAQLSSRFKPAYPRRKQLKAQVEKMRRRLSQEIQRVVDGIESAYLAATATEQELAARMEEQKTAILRLQNAAVEYTILAREVDTNRQLYDSVLQRMKEMGVAAELRASNVSVIDRAFPPHTPAKPRKALALLVSCLVGVLGGVGAAFFCEYLDDTLKTPEDAERYLRLPHLGTVPDFLTLAPRSVGSPAERAAALFTHTSQASWPLPTHELLLSHPPLSMIAEAYRAIRTAILLSRAGEPPKTVLFTSGIHGEGKTATTLNTAIIFAQMGVRVLVIDADLRHPRCHAVLGMEKRLGLTKVLTGQSTPQELIRPASTLPFSFLSSGIVPPNPTELLGSQKMRETIATLQAHYDYILIDASPVIPVSDAVLLSTMVDGVVLVVDGQNAPRRVVREACWRLEYARAKVLGVVLNRMDVREGDYTYYCSHAYADSDWDSPLGGTYERQQDGAAPLRRG